MLPTAINVDKPLIASPKVVGIPSPIELLPSSVPLDEYVLGLIETSLVAVVPVRMALMPRASLMLWAMLSS
jgi:hypothetical protein